MKKLIFLNTIIFVLSTQLNHAQKERITYLPNVDKKTLHFGYYLGLNKNSFKVSYFDQGGDNRLPDPNSPVNPFPEKDMFLSVNSSVGFNLGFIIDYRLHKNINLRFEPGLMSNAKELTFIDPNLDAAINGIPIYRGNKDPVRKIAGTYVHLPLLLKFSTNRLNNMRPYVIGGVSYDFNLSSNQNNTKDNYDAEFRMTKSNFMYEVGIGMDFYFYFFKFSPSIRSVFAISNEIVPDEIRNQYSSPWTGPIDYFGTRGFYLNLTFE